MGRGPVEFVVVEFGGPEIDPSLAPALRNQVEKGTIRVIDLLFVRKDAGGAINTFELEEAGGGDGHAAFRGVAQSIDGLISPEDVGEVSESLAPGRVAMIVLFEHLWLRELRAAVEAGHGHVVFTERIPGEIVDTVAEAVRAMA